MNNRSIILEFDPPFHRNMIVVVVPMTQTYRGSETPGLRIKDVSNTSFKVHFDEVVILKENDKYSSDGGHTDDTVGWVAYGFEKKRD